MQTVAALDTRLNYTVPLVGNGLNRAGTWSEWRCSFLLVHVQSCVRSTNQISEHVLCAVIIQIWNLFFRFMLQPMRNHICLQRKERQIFKTLMDRSYQFIEKHCITHSASRWTWRRIKARKSANRKVVHSNAETQGENLKSSKRKMTIYFSSEKMEARTQRNKTFKVFKGKK